MIVKLKSIFNHQGFIKYFKNTLWLFGERILRIIVGLFVGIWIARYLGPEQFGLFSYVQSFVGLFTVIATLGLDGIVVRELVKDKKHRSEIIGTVFWLKLMGSFGMLIVLSVAVNFTSNDNFTNILVAIVASSTIFQSFHVIDSYFQSVVMSKFVVYANVISLLLSSIVKIVLILNEAPLIAFAGVVLFDSFVLTCGFIYFFLQNTKYRIKNLVFTMSIAKKLLKDGWPMMVAGVAIMVYMKIDQVMIKEMMDSASVGQYAAAMRISEAWYFIPIIIVASFFPAIVNAKKQSDELYYSRLQKLYNLMAWVPIAVALPMTFLSDWVIYLLYGGQYSQAGDVLMITIWAGVFVFLSVVNDKWFYVENRAQLLMFKVLIGAISNILLNVLLIPLYGIKGAAIATVIGYSISVIWSDLFFKEMHKLFIMKVKALLFYEPIKLIFKFGTKK